MQFDEDQDSAGSNDGSSDEEQNERNDQQEQIDEADDQEGEDEGDEDEDDGGDDDGEEEDQTNEQDDTTLRSEGTKSSWQNSNNINKSGDAAVPTSLGTTPHLPPPSIVDPMAPASETSPGSPGTRVLYSIRPEALTASVYDIVPTIAAPQSTSINTVTATPDLRWVFSGGSDGYIRKFNWLDTANAKLMLTVAQKHPFVDSVTKAGVLTSYWENEDPSVKSNGEGQGLSPVYSLAVQNQALWLLSGLESGGINLQTVRHDEGKRITCLKKHTSAVSVLNLAQDEKSVLSGSWDKLVMDWDLNTGDVKRTFDGDGGQISAIEMRPASSLPVPVTINEPKVANGTFSSNNSKPQTNGISSNGAGSNANGTGNDEQRGLSPIDSLFGEDDNGSLFGESAANPGFGDDDDEFSRAVANGVPQPENEDEGDINMTDAGEVESNAQPENVGVASTSIESSNHPPEPVPDNTNLTNGLPHAEDLEKSSEPMDTSHDTTGTSSSTDTTFLAASFDGSIRIWDKRQQAPAATIVSRNAPPWCMGACWSPDGNFIYAGRRNGTVEEFSLHKGLQNADRTFKFPNGSGPVSAVRAMPNGRHLVCASYDILRLYDLSQQQIFKHSTVPFLIVPGHRTGVISQLYIDPTCRFMISTAGNRGWEGSTTQVLLGYEINI